MARSHLHIVSSRSVSCLRMMIIDNGEWIIVNCAMSDLCYPSTGSAYPLI
jgi:hypothetical protein